jgi:hypothetical protein
VETVVTFGFRRKKGNEVAVSAGASEIGGMEFAVPTPEERTFLKRAGEYGKLSGTGKRVRMLRDAYDDCTARLAQLRNRAGEQNPAAIAELEKKRTAIGEESSEAARKQVFGDRKAPDLMTFGEAVFRKCSSGVLEVTLPVAVADGILAAGTVIDGTIAAEVRSGERFVGNVLMPLPVTGIGAGEWLLKGLCIRSLPDDAAYALKIAQRQKLWIMEK